MKLSPLLSALALAIPAYVTAFTASADTNVAVYWGQNSAGSTDSQQRLSEYCDDSADIVLLSFLHVFFGTGGAPEVNFAASCNDGTVFPGTALLQCPTIAEDIKTCQNKGKIILLSLGGASGSYGFTSDSEAEEFAQTVWDMFGGGSSDTRPFGDSIVDGFDLDIEGGSTVGYAAFSNKLRELYSTDSSKEYYIAAAPQCPVPDTYLNSAITESKIDFLFVQFYNNYCGMQAWQANNANPNFNYAAWDSLVKSSPNPSAKVYLGVPASSTAAGSGYVGIDTVVQAANYLQSTYSTFGGVMMWDASQAWANVDSSTNKNFAQGAKDGLLGNSGSSPASSSAVVVTIQSSTSTQAVVVESSTQAPVVQSSTEAAVVTVESSTTPAVVTVESTTEPAVVTVESSTEPAVVTVESSTEPAVVTVESSTKPAVVTVKSSTTPASSTSPASSSIPASSSASTSSTSSTSSNVETSSESVATTETPTEPAVVIVSSTVVVTIKPSGPLVVTLTTYVDNLDGESTTTAEPTTVSEEPTTSDAVTTTLATTSSAAETQDSIAEDPTTSSPSPEQTTTSTNEPSTVAPTTTSQSTQPVVVTTAPETTTPSYRIIGYSIISSLNTDGALIYGYSTKVDSEPTSTFVVLGARDLFELGLTDLPTALPTSQAFSPNDVDVLAVMTADASSYTGAQLPGIMPSGIPNPESVLSDGTEIFDLHSATQVLGHSHVYGHGSSQSTFLSVPTDLPSTLVKINQPLTTLSIVPSISKTSENSATSVSTTASTASSQNSCPVHGGVCETEGEFRCTLQGYAQCIEGSWIVRPCTVGTICKQDGSDVYCDWAGDYVFSEDSCGGFISPTADLFKRTTEANGSDKNSTEIFDDGEFEGKTPSNDTLTDTMYTLKISVQQLNSTNFRGMITASTITNNPIGENWHLSFSSSLNIEGVDRGDFEYDDSTNIYTITSIPREEPSSNMAILIPFWGTFE